MRALCVSSERCDAPQRAACCGPVGGRPGIMPGEGYKAPPGRGSPDGAVGRQEDSGAVAARRGLLHQHSCDAYRHKAMRLELASRMTLDNSESTGIEQGSVEQVVLVRKCQ